jgi:hypothetical protein
MITFSLFLLGMALCLWRAPQGGWLHVILRSVAATLWCGLLLFDPATRTPMFGFAVSMFLWAGSRLQR